MFYLSDFDGTRPLFSYNLVGTHDCATKYVMFSRATKCQNMTIAEQLESGVRVLDIRVAPLFGKLALVHAVALIFKNKSKRLLWLDDVLNDCYDFLNNNPREVIVFQFKSDFFDSELLEKKCAKIFYNKYIKGNENRWFLENRVPTLDEARGKLVLLRRCTAHKGADKNNFGIDFSKWVDQDTAIPDSLVLKTNSADNAEFLIQDRYKYGAKERWEKCIEPMFGSSGEFDGRYKLLYTSTSGGGNPEENAGYINKRILSLELEKGKYYGIVYFDFVTGELVKKIRETNC